MRSLYTTILDKHFLARAVCLYESWREYSASGMFAFYCMDSEAAEIVEKLSLSRALVVRYDEFATSALRAAEAGRTMAEYCWTAKGFALNHAIHEAQSDWNWVVYLDSDMMFFCEGDSVLRGTDGDFLLTPHRFSSDFVSFQQSVGRYNAGYVAIRNSNTGRRALTWWNERCIEWCGAEPAEEKYSDQKYLDKLPELFGGSDRIIKGLNTAPWNIDNYRIQKKEDGIYVDDERLILYHFQGLKVHGAHLFDMYTGSRRLPPKAVRLIYHPYIRRLSESVKRVRGAGADPRWGIQGRIWHPEVMYWTGRKLFKRVCNLSVVTG